MLPGRDGLMDDGARRLERAARAEGLRPLFAEQIDLIAGTRERLVNDARRTLELLAETRAELAQAFVAPRATASSSTKSRRKAATTRKTPVRGKKRTGRRKAR